MSPISKPSEAPSSGSGIGQYEGCLLVLTLTGRGESQYDSKSPVKPSVTLDVLVVDSPKAGQLGTQTSINKEPAVIAAKAGDQGSVIASQGYVVGSFNKAELGKVVAGRLICKPVEKDGEMVRTWLLLDPDKAEYDQAVSAYESAQRPAMSTPSQSAASEPGPSF